MARHEVTVQPNPTRPERSARVACTCGWAGPLRSRERGWTDVEILAFDGRRCPMRKVRK